MRHTCDGVTATTIYMALVHTRMSAPTAAFRHAPGLTPDDAADLVARAIVERPRTIAPWWLTPAALLADVARGPVEAPFAEYRGEGQQLGIEQAHGGL